MRVHVAYAAPGSELVIALDVADGATVADALRIADVAQRIGMVPDDAGLAIFGQRVDGSTPLRDGDRVEITRPLACDPKVARHARAVGSHAVRPRADRRRRSAS
jgi:putative ubiquitin-RnfH superfamily antitoxin RatB of RatAB toxin-antitoxin module